MPGAKVITKQKKASKSKDKIAKEKREKNNKTLRNAGGVAKNKHPNAMTAEDRKKYKGKSLTEIIKGVFGGGKAKAATPKKKPLSPAQKKRSTAVQKAEDARRKRQKDNMKKDAAKAHYSSVPGYKGKAGGQNPKSKSYRERLADQKKKAAKKASDAKAADTRDAKRGGFITAKAAKTAGRKANEKVAANKKRRSDELVSRGRK